MNESYLFYNYLFQNQMKKCIKTLSKSLLYLQITNVNTRIDGTQEISGDSVKLKIMLSARAALFAKVKPVLMNFVRCCFEMD